MNLNAFLILATLIRLKKTTYTELISEFSTGPFPLQSHQIAYCLSLLEKQKLIEKTPLNVIPYKVEIRPSKQGAILFQKFIRMTNIQSSEPSIMTFDQGKTGKIDNDDIMDMQEAIQEILSDYSPSIEGAEFTMRALTNLFIQFINRA